MKDNGKKANRSALIMRPASWAKSEEFWFILLNSPVAWKDSWFNCSLVLEALASKEVDGFTKLGMYCALSFGDSLFSELAKGTWASRLFGAILWFHCLMKIGESMHLGPDLSVIKPRCQSTTSYCPSFSSKNFLQNKCNFLFLRGGHKLQTMNKGLIGLILISY